MRTTVRLILVTAVILAILISASPPSVRAAIDQLILAPTGATPSGTREATPESTEDATIEPTANTGPTAEGGRRGAQATPTRTPAPTRPAATRTPRPSPSPTATALKYGDGGPITLDQDVSETLDGKTPGYVYSFDGEADQQLTISVKTTRTLSALVGIYLFSGTKFENGQNFESFTVKANSSGDMQVTLPEKATYQVVISRVGPGTGQYTLTISAVNKFPQTIVTAGTARTVVAGLQQAGIAPAGGKQVLTLDSSFGKTSDPGFSFLVVGRGLNVQDLVLQFSVSWATAGDTSGCGFLFRSAASGNNNTIALVTNDGYAVLYHFIGNQTGFKHDEPSDAFTPGQPTVVTIIAIQDELAMYVNGKLITSGKTTGAVVSGGTAIEVYNAKTNTTLTDCRFRNIWAWSFD